MCLERYRYVTNYQKDKVLWGALNVLTQEVFNFQFKERVGVQYIPHSLMDRDKMIANVSVNIMNFQMDGVYKNYIQIGTVMTHKNYRGQGLGRYLIEKILEEYKDKVDGIYLFANDSVLDFYPKFGFEKGKEFQYSKSIKCENLSHTIEKVNVLGGEHQKRFLETLSNTIANERLAMNYLGLLRFWLLGPMCEEIYYLKSQEAYIVAEYEKDILHIHQVIATHKVDLDKVIYSFGEGIQKVILGFTPENGEGYTVKEYHEEECTFFYMGEDLKLIEDKQFIFPKLSHA